VSLAAALDSAKAIAGHVRDKAVEGANAADETVRESPYQAIGIAFGVGALIGYLVMRPLQRRLMTRMADGVTVPFFLAAGISLAAGCRITLPMLLVFRRLAGRFIYGPDQRWKRNSRS
jgi:DUF883 C-terminal glycine zipper region